LDRRHGRGRGQAEANVRRIAETGKHDTAQGVGSRLTPKDWGLRMLDRLEASIRPEDINLSGYHFHGLRGDHVGTYAVSVTGTLRITFAFDGEDAIDVDLEDYRR
jgi:proteic killer suppression protein